MGKYMQKPKVTSDVAMKEVSPSSLGVRTRSRTLALQRLESSTDTTTPPTSNPDSCYLELRSRRLLKVEQKNSHNSCEKEFSGSGSMSGSIGRANKDKECFEVRSSEWETGSIGRAQLEDTSGSNDLDFKAKERSSRETTPSSLIMTANTVATPCPTTRHTNPAARQSIGDALCRNILSASEIEEFLAFGEQLQLRHFTEKYNFDFVNELPLPGRYEWVKPTT